MAFFSTQLRNDLLVTGSLKTLMDDSVIVIFKGTVPATADADTTGATEIALISVNGGAVTSTNGLNFDTTATSGQLSKSSSETWKEDVIYNSGGTATFWRMVLRTDYNAGTHTTSSTVKRRIQGTIGTAGADINLSSTSLVAGAEQPINYFLVSIPAGA